MQRWYIGLGVVLVVLAGCSDTTVTDDGSSSTTTAAVVDGSTVASESTQPTEGPPFEVTATLTVAYQEPTAGWKAPELDVYAPVGDGPWPVVISYHPDMAHNNRASMSNVAKKLAEMGAVVFNPNYGLPGRSSEALRYYAESSQLSCIYWYVHENAASFGGDPADITLFGFSGGAMAASATVMADDMDPSGCFADPAAIEPRSVILFEGDWTLAPFWDMVLAADPDVYEQSMVWARIDTYAGPPLHFIIDEQTATSHRFQVQTDDIDEYLRLRESVDLRADLVAIGAFDDELLDITEASRLFHHRIESAGNATTLTTTNSGIHSITADVFNVVAELVFETRSGD